MPNTLDANGLTVKTLTELTADLTTGMQGIYGADINVESNSPDGQLINVFAQALSDNLEVLVDVYNAVDPELATGVNLDKVLAFNGILRFGATYTTTPVVITTNRALTLVGLDALIANPQALVFAVQDSNKNVFQLLTSYTFATADTQSLTFRAQDPGSLNVLPNTIKEQNTPQTGVTAVSNATISGTVVGVDEETDSAFKIRRGRMFSLAAAGPADAVQAALLSTPQAASDAMVVENDTAGEVDSVPAHSIYCIVRDNGDVGHPDSIATKIMAKKMPGCGLYGGESATITRSNGLPFVGKWDWAVPQPLYITFGITPKTAGVTFDPAVVAAELAAALVFFLGQAPTIGDVVVAMSSLFPSAIVTSCGVGAAPESYGDVVYPTALLNYFTVEAADIIIT